DGIRDFHVTGVQTCALPILARAGGRVTQSAVGHVAALDFGATSGRVIVGEVGPDVLRTQQYARFANRPVHAGGRLHWDVLSLWQGALDGIAAAARAVPNLSSVATDT